MNKHSVSQQSLKGKSALDIALEQREQEDQKKAALEKAAILGGPPGGPQREQPRVDYQSNSPSAPRQEKSAKPHKEVDPDTGRATDQDGNPWYITQKSKAHVLHLFNRELAFKETIVRESPAPPPVREHGDIRRFSKKSRLRLLRMMNQLRTEHLCRPRFLTLTVRHGEHTPEQFRDDYFPRFLACVRNLIGEHAYLWRLEFHKDGFPHIHLILWEFRTPSGVSDETIAQRLKLAWWSITGDESPAAMKHSCRVDRCYSFRQVLSYVAKYVAKEDPEEQPTLHGRRWGRSYNLNTEPVQQIELNEDEATAFRKVAHNFLKRRSGTHPKSIENIAERTAGWLWLDPPEILEILKQFLPYEKYQIYEEYVARYEEYKMW